MNTCYVALFQQAIYKAHAPVFGVQAAENTGPPVLSRTISARSVTVHGWPMYANMEGEASEDSHLRVSTKERKGRKKNQIKKTVK